MGTLYYPLKGVYIYISIIYVCRALSPSFPTKKQEALQELGI